jgi:hypothetical protein
MMKRALIATVAGGVAIFLLAALLDGLILVPVYKVNPGSATDVFREIPVLWALVLSHLGQAAIVTFLFMHAGVRTALDGLKVGAVFGLMLGVYVAFDLYAVTNLSSLPVPLVEVLVVCARIALAGAAIGWVLGVGSRDGRSPSESTA